MVAQTEKNSAPTNAWRLGDRTSTIRLPFTAWEAWGTESFKSGRIKASGTFDGPSLLETSRPTLPQLASSCCMPSLDRPDLGRTRYAAPLRYTRSSFCLFFKRSNREQPDFR